MNSPVRNSTATKAPRGTKPHSIVTIGPERRHSVIAGVAYYFSEHRGFAPGHELDDWLAAENQIDAASGLSDTPHAGPSSIPTSADDVAQEQSMTEEPKRDQEPWYPRMESMPPLYNVETWQNLSEDNPVLRLLDAEAEEDESLAGDRVVRETVRSTAAIAPVEICADEVWARGGTALSTLFC